MGGLDMSSTNPLDQSMTLDRSMNKSILNRSSLTFGHPDPGRNTRKVTQFRASRRIGQQTIGIDDIREILVIKHHPQIVQVIS